jgi:hypothetical protein
VIARASELDEAIPYFVCDRHRQQLRRVYGKGIITVKRIPGQPLDAYRLRGAVAREFRRKLNYCDVWQYFDSKKPVVGD